MRNRASYSARLLCGTAMAVVTLTAAPAFAEGRAINIEPQSLASALREFASQSQQAILVSPSLADNKTSQGVHDTADPEMALAQLLQGTGLTWRRSGEALLIVDAADPQSGSAAGDGADSGTVQALVVTAQKREENIQDVPIAMSAFTQEDLTRSQVAGGPDLMTQVPNFTFTKTNFSSYSIQIRGIGTQAISATVDPAVAVAFNNTPFIRNRFFEQEFYDLQRIEVLRGPQGTLYGRNATAGVVNILSAKPSFRYEAKLSADVANYKSTRLEGMINIPLVDDKVALRLAGAWTKRDGYDTNELTGQQIDGRNLWSTRLSLRIEPTDNIKADLIWEHFQEDDDRLRSGKQLCKRDTVTEIGGVAVPQNGGDAGSPQTAFSLGCAPASLYSDEAFQVPNGFALPYYSPITQIGLPAPDHFDPYTSATQSRDLRVIESILTPIYKARSDIGELQITADLTRNLTLASETAYSTDTLFSFEDFNRFNTRPGAFAQTSNANHDGVLVNGVFCDPQLGCSDRLVLGDLSTAKSGQFSEELRLSSNFDGPLNFSLGANFLRYDTEDKYYVFANSLSLWAANASWTGDFGGNSPYDATEIPYVSGVYDNHQCIRTRRVGDPTAPQSLTGCIPMDPNPVTSLNDQGHNYFLSRNPYRLISYAAFGEAYYSVTPNLKITAGLRWTVDKKRAPRIPSWLIVADTVGYPVMEVVTQEWREPTGRLTVDWKPDLGFTDETLLYASYAHGYKAGGMNPPPAVIAEYSNFPGLQESLIQPKVFDPEFVDAYEIGSKNTFFGGRATFNMNAFYYDYNNYQLSQIINRSAVTHNFDATVWGIEMEADWRPLENLRLGFKGGYENTRVANGERDIDIMDRTAGDPNYIVMRPFPTVPSNCIAPVWLITFGGEFQGDPNGSGGNPGFCAFAYIEHVDPVTELPYVANPTVEWDGPLNPRWAGYPGFDYTAVPNNGEGIYKDLGGNELPNAPHFTTTLTADYTVPLPHDWLMTLHADYYHQSKAWTRIFNFDPYDRLKPYTNVNFAAIFSNEDAGWNVMAYVKNIFDNDAITGAFLNSDDTGLTTNVFLLEPRLYGLRVTKQWTGTPFWGDSDAHKAGEPYPLSVEIGGQVQRHDAPNEPFAPGFVDRFTSLQFPLGVQNEDLDWGDGRDVKVTYRPHNSPWSVSAAVRFGKTNGRGEKTVADNLPGGCALQQSFCDMYAEQYPQFYIRASNYGSSWTSDREDHTLVDFMIGRDIGLGSAPRWLNSSIAVGLRYARLASSSKGELWGMPDLYLPPENVFKYQAHFDRDTASFAVERKFQGAGPELSWDASKSLIGNDQLGEVSIEWNVTGGVLFGKQETAFNDHTESWYFEGKYSGRGGGGDPVQIVTNNAGRTQKSSATVPNLGLSFGLAYEIQRIKVSGGYRIDKFYNVVDGGVEQRKKEDRTIDGPYFKVAIGFGG